MTIEELILKWEQKKVTAKHKRYIYFEHKQYIDSERYNRTAMAISAMLKDLKNLPNEPKTISNNEHIRKICASCSCFKDVMLPTEEDCKKCGR